MPFCGQLKIVPYDSRHYFENHFCAGNCWGDLFNLRFGNLQKAGEMILKYTEYKIICDVCAHDIIGWDGFESREEVAEEYKRQFGNLPKKWTICEDCKNKTIKPIEREGEK